MTRACSEVPAMQPGLEDAEYRELDAILDDLRSRYDETPQWEFCEGFMVALLCCRRIIEPGEYWPVLLAIGDDAELQQGAFAQTAQQQRFTQLWLRRWFEVARALDADIDSLDDPAAYQPEVMDVRGAVAALTEDERAAMPAATLPAFAQVWALGFMFAVETWPDDWSANGDGELPAWLNRQLQAVIALTEDDDAEPTLSMYDADGSPSLSVNRLNAFAAAIWAAYELRRLGRGYAG